MKLLTSNKSDASNFAKQEKLKDQEQAYIKTKGVSQWKQLHLAVSQFVLVWYLQA